MSDTWAGNGGYFARQKWSCCHHVHEHCEGHEHRDLQGHLLAGVGGEVEAQHSHAAGKQTWLLCSVQMCAPRYQHTGTDEV